MLLQNKHDNICEKKNNLSAFTLFFFLYSYLVCVCL